MSISARERNAEFGVFGGCQQVPSKSFRDSSSCFSAENIGTQKLKYFEADGSPVTNKRFTPVAKDRKGSLDQMRYTTLLTYTETCDDSPISLDVLFLKVIQQTAASPDHSQKSPAGMMIFGVNLKVFGQIRNFFA
jgi:hypothetical protein